MCVCVWGGICGVCIMSVMHVVVEDYLFCDMEYTNDTGTILATRHIKMLLVTDILKCLISHYI